jgi:hypothetical protein
MAFKIKTLKQAVIQQFNVVILSFNLGKLCNRLPMSI